MTVTIPSLINELKTIGYDLYLEGENLKYRYIASTEPPKDKVIPLLNTIKRSKGEVKEYLTFKDKPIPFNTLWGLFKDTLKRVDTPDRVWAGVMQAPGYRQAWDNLNGICLDCLEGRAGIGEYQDILKEWEGIAGGIPYTGVKG